jgi:hypothetical protein
MPESDAPMLRVPEAAKRVGLTTRELYGLIDEGKVPAFRSKKTRMCVIPPEALEPLRQRLAKPE